MTLSIVLVLYALLGTATIVILRAMARRWRENPLDDLEVPYGPSEQEPAAIATGGAGQS